MGDPSIATRARAKQDRRLLAVLALLQGLPATAICQQYQMGRSDLYKYRQRALTAMHQALADRRRGPRRPHNRLEVAREQAVVSG